MSNYKCFYRVIDLEPILTESDGEPRLVIAIIYWVITGGITFALDVSISVLAEGLRSNIGSLFLRRNVLIWVYIRNWHRRATKDVFTELFISIDRDDTDI